MIAIVCGGRGYTDANKVFATLDKLRDEDGLNYVVEGGAKGADALAMQWAMSQPFTAGISWSKCPADWNKWGKAAGSVRNQYMLDQFKPSLVVAFPGGPGTKDMVRRAKKHNVRVLEVV